MQDNDIYARKIAMMLLVLILLVFSFLALLPVIFTHQNFRPLFGLD